MNGISFPAWSSLWVGQNLITKSSTHSQFQNCEFIFRCCLHCWNSLGHNTHKNNSFCPEMWTTNSAQTIVFNFDWWIHLRPGCGSTIRIKQICAKYELWKNQRIVYYVRLQLQIKQSGADIAYCFFFNSFAVLLFPIRVFFLHSSGNFFMRFSSHSHCVHGCSPCFFPCNDTIDSM